MTRAVLCLLVSIAALCVGLFTAKLCSQNTLRGESLHRLHLYNEMQAARNEVLAAEVESHRPGAGGELESSENAVEVEQ